MVGSLKKALQIETVVCVTVKVCSHVTDFSPSYAPFNGSFFLLPIKHTIECDNWVTTHSVHYSAR